MRRTVFPILLSFLFLLPLYLWAGHNESTAAQNAPASVHASSPAASQNPNDVLAELLRGNKRFVKSASLYSNQDGKRRTETALNGQKPLATILSCSDSRVPLEIIFDQGIGDIFVIRIAGNIADKTEVGSIEYGVGHLGTPLLIVLGHTKCGAVTAAVKNSDVGGSIPSLIERIKPAVLKARANHQEQSEDELIMNSIKANVFQSIEDIFKASEKVGMLVREGKLKVIGALYDIETGVVSDLGVHYKQEALIRGQGK
jgi:carbonic anhydrase